MSTFYDKTPSGEPLRPLFPQDFPKDIVGIVEDYLWGQPKNIIKILRKMVPIYDKDDSKTTEDILKIIVDTYTEHCGFGVEGFMEINGAKIYALFSSGDSFNNKHSIDDCWAAFSYGLSANLKELGYESFKFENNLAQIHNTYTQAIEETFQNKGIDNIYDYIGIMKETHSLVRIVCENYIDVMMILKKYYSFYSDYHGELYFIVKKCEVDNLIKMISPGLVFYVGEL